MKPRDPVTPAPRPDAPFEGKVRPAHRRDVSFEGKVRPAPRPDLPFEGDVSRARLERDRQLFMFDPRAAPPTTIQRGNAGEERAAAYLQKLGWRIVARNYRTKLGELDIVAREGETLVFVEVRTRSNYNFGQAIEMVNIHKQRQVTRVAKQYLTQRRPPFDIARFDVIGITAGDLVHIRDAFRLG